MPKVAPVITSTPADVVTRRSVPLTQAQLDQLRDMAREGRRTLSAQMSMLLTEALEKQPQRARRSPDRKRKRPLISWRLGGAS